MDAPTQLREATQRWEYLVLHPSYEAFTGKLSEVDRNQLARLGREGWELVAVDRLGMGSNYIFKRPLR